MDSNFATVVTAVDAKDDRQVSTNVALIPKVNVQMTKTNVTRFRISGAVGLFADDINGEYAQQGVSRHSTKPFYVRTHMGNGTPIEYDPNKLLKCSGDQLGNDEPYDAPWREHAVAGNPSTQ